MKLFELERRFLLRRGSVLDDIEKAGVTYHGHIARPTAAQIYPPLRMLIYRGRRAVISVPAETELAAMLVPS